MKGADSEESQPHPIAEAEQEWQMWKWAGYPSTEDVKTRVLNGIPSPKQLRKKCKLCRRIVVECKCPKPPQKRSTPVTDVYVFTSGDPAHGTVMRDPSMR